MITFCMSRSGIKSYLSFEMNESVERTKINLKIELSAHLLCRSLAKDKTLREVTVERD